MTLSIFNVEPDNYNPRARALLEAVGDITDGPCSREELLNGLSDTEILIVRLGHRIDKELIDKASILKIIVTATTGLNHIDTEYAELKGINVLSLKGETQFLETLTATAELTWGLILTLIRKLPAALTHVGEGFWERDLFRGNQLKGKTLGIIGYGRLGKIVANYGIAFQMEVIIADPFVNHVPEKIVKTNLEELLKRSNIISLHVPLEDETLNMLSHPEFSLMKKGSILINTSRGELINEGALLDALRSGSLGGAAFDVLVGETEHDDNWPKNSTLWQFAKNKENILISPHIGGATIESMADSELFMAEKLTNIIENSL